MYSKIIIEQSTYYLYPLYGFANTIVTSVTSNTRPRMFLFMRWVRSRARINSYLSY